MQQCRCSMRRPAVGDGLEGDWAVENSGVCAGLVAHAGVRRAGALAGGGWPLTMAGYVSVGFLD